MDTIANLKERVVAETPLLLFEATLANGTIERWSTHQVTFENNPYDARVLRHNLFEIQTASEQGIDAMPRLSLTLANADSHFSQIECSVGWKGAKLKATFLFYDLMANEPASESLVLFQGLLNPPDEITEDRDAIQDAQVAIEKAVAAEDPLVESINRFCESGEKPPQRAPGPPPSPGRPRPGDEHRHET